MTRPNEAASVEARKVEPATAPHPEVHARFVTVRAVTLACALMPLLLLWLVNSELIWYSASSTAISLFFHVTFVIVVLALFNLLLEQYRPSWAFSPGELMTIYMMLSVASTFCSHDLLQILIPMLGFPAYFANPQNNWQEVILKHIPDWAILTPLEGSAAPREAMTGLAVGNSWLYKTNVLLAWVKPLTFWFVFLMALMGALLAINIFFRQQWTEREKLSFPVIQIPMIIATQLRELLHSKLFWLAFCLTAGIDTINNIHWFYPVVPEIPIVKVFTFSDYFVERPWNVIAATEINLYPFVIGLVFFMPVDLAFSCWFFFLFFKIQQVVAAAMGISDLPGFPFPNEQAAGGYIALGLLALWLSRRHFRNIWRTILGRPGGADDSHEPMSYRNTLALFIICMVILMVQAVMITWKSTSAGIVSDGRVTGQFYASVLSGVFGGGSAMPFYKTLAGAVFSNLSFTLLVMGAFFTIFLLYSIAIARMRAELGPPAHDLHAMGPDAVIHNALGTHHLGTANIAGFTMFFWFNRAYRAHFSAHSMEGFKLAQLTRITSRSMMKAMVLAVVLGAAVSIWALMHALYVHGYSGRLAGDAFSAEAWNKMASWVTFPQKPRVAATVATVATGLGLIFSLFLGAMRMRYTWWVWHPVGYATSTSWSMERLWFCLFLGWLLKALIIRYGGAQLYRRTMPFFVGLVLGEFVVGSLWMIFGAIVGTQVYRFWG